MDSTKEIYLGRIIDKKNFRVFIYDKDGNKKLIENWNDFEKHIETGNWFITKKDIKKEEKELNILELNSEIENIAESIKKRAARKPKSEEIPIPFIQKNE